MKSSVLRVDLPVVTPFRLDMTVDALRRLSSNVVDRFTDEGQYMRVLADRDGTALLRVRQASKSSLHVEIEGDCGQRFVPVLERMLGTKVDLTSWYQRSRVVPWLNGFAAQVRGVKPPRYPTLWEALCHAIIFQQISIHAAGAIMQRMVEGFGTPVLVEGEPLYPFPAPEALAQASSERMRAVSLSTNKIVALQSIAQGLIAGTVQPDAIAALPLEDAAARLCALRGIGPWSAAVVLLRGLGRLEVFPMNDSGVAASLRLLSGNQTTDIDRLLLELGDQRGMLYFHLLLGRIAHRRAAKQANAATGPGL